MHPSHATTEGACLLPTGTAVGWARYQTTHRLKQNESIRSAGTRKGAPTQGAEASTGWGPLLSDSGMWGM